MLSTPSSARLVLGNTSPELFSLTWSPQLLMKSGLGLIANFSILSSLSLARKMLRITLLEATTPVNSFATRKLQLSLLRCCCVYLNVSLLACSWEGNSGFVP